MRWADGVLLGVCAVMVGAVSVLLVILRTAMDTPTKKFSPL